GDLPSPEEVEAHHAEDDRPAHEHCHREEGWHLAQIDQRAHDRKHLIDRIERDDRLKSGMREVILYGKYYSGPVHKKSVHDPHDVRKIWKFETKWCQKKPNPK